MAQQCFGTERKPLVQEVKCTAILYNHCKESYPVPKSFSSVRRKLQVTRDIFYCKIEKQNKMVPFFNYNYPCSFIVVVPGSVARTIARRSSWAVSHRTPELKVVTPDNSEVNGSLNGPLTPIFRPRG